MQRVIPLDGAGPGHPHGARVGVPLDVVHCQAVERKAAEEDATFVSSSAVIPGVRFEEGHPLDLRTPADVGLVRHAVAQRWPISPEMRQVIADTMMQIVREADMPRDKINAAKVLVAGDRINSREQVPDQQHITLDVRNLSDAELAARLAALEEMERAAQLPPSPVVAGQSADREQVT